nr:flagellar basal body protein [Pseudotabrizicola algicola]
MDISRSGLLAYRTALAVTAENIANVGTDGYRRRDVSTVTAGGGQSTATTLATGGQGVSVADVRRAFDDLAAERARSAAGAEAAASSHLAGARAIETLMIPGDDGIDGTLRNFFDAISRFADNPTDHVTRSLTLGAGKAAAEAISHLADGLAGVRSDLVKEAARAAQTAQTLLEDLADVSRRMGAPAAPNSTAMAAMHPLADRRDAILGELAQLLPISVTLDGQRPVVRFGSEAGPLLLEGVRSAKLSVSASDQLSLRIVAADGASRETRSIGQGQIGGLSRALGALDMTTAELDAFARTLSNGMNQLHRSGMDLLGRPGGDLFRSDGWTAQAATANAGTVQINLGTTSAETAGTAYDLMFDAPAGLWRARGPDGVELAAGADKLVLPGVVVEIAGRAAHGDRIAIVPTNGRAADLRLATTDPTRLAAASAFAATASPANAGTAGLTAVQITPPASALPNLNFGAEGEAVYLSAGAVGLIAAGSSEVTLASLGRSASTLLAPLAGAERLELAFGAGRDGFDLTGLSGAAAQAAALNTGQITSDTGKSLSALGLVASADAAGALILSRPGAGAAVPATLSGAAGTVIGLETPAEAAGAGLQVITRNGRHIAGTPLTASEITALMTSENGFLPGAVYDPSPLMPQTGAGYRGTGLDRVDVPGVQGVTVQTTALVTASASPIPSSPPRQLILSDASGASTSVELPAGASAALVASRLNGALPGFAAKASTAVELSGFAPGTVTFALAGANGSPLHVSATLSTGDASPLALAINALSGASGVRAEMSPDGARLLLVQADGHDITLSGLGSGVSNGLQVTPTSPGGLPRGPATVWTPGQIVKLGGEVAVTAVQGFTLTEGSSALLSATQTSSAVTLQTSAAGARAALTFRDVPAGAEGGLLHVLTVAGQRYETALPPGTTGADASRAVARVLRQGAPDAVLTGQPLAALPPNGSALSVTVEGAVFSLRIEDGQPVLSGPEEGRVTAHFDAQNRLVIAAANISDGKGIAVSPAPAFGFAAAGGTLTLSGQPPDPARLPATLSLRLEGETYAITLGQGGALDLPAGFPGEASRDPLTGALRLTLPAPAVGLAVSAQSATGFGGPGIAVRLDGGSLALAGDGPPLDVESSLHGSLGQSLRLTNLPPEDLVVAVTGNGLLRLSGSVTPPVAATAPQGPGALTLEIVDAASGRVALSDAITGHRVAEGTLDAGGRVTLAGLSLQLRGNPASGDRFGIVPARAGSANADIALSLAALRNADPATGSPGLTDRLNRLQGDTGLRAAGAARAQATARAAAEASEREQAAIGAVDLDTEAARLLELQQAYQASAQAAGVARALFDTLIKMF